MSGAQVAMEKRNRLRELAQSYLEAAELAPNLKMRCQFAREAIDLVRRAERIDLWRGICTGVTVRSACPRESGERTMT
jgi:hypothetical protein